jgi:hypothetical protein
MWIVFVLTPLQMVLGDMHGATRLSINRWRWERWKETGRETGRSQPLTLFAWPDEAAERNEFLLAIPPLGRLILSHDRNGEVDWTEGSTADRPPFDWSLLAFAQQASRRPLVLRPLRFLEPAPCLWSLAHRRRGAAGGRGFGRNLSHPIRSSFIRYYWLHSSTTPPESRPGCRLGIGMRVCHYQK